MTTPQTDLKAQAASCLEAAKTTMAFLEANGSGRLGFDLQAFPWFPPCDEETERARNTLRSAARTL